MIVLGLLVSQLSAQTVSTARSEYLPDEDIKVQWSHPLREDRDSPKWSLYITPLSEAQFAAGGVQKLDGKYGRHSYRQTDEGKGELVITPPWGLLPLGDTHQHYSAAVADPMLGQPLAQHLFTIASPLERWQPGLLSIVSEPPFVTGSRILFKAPGVREVSDTGLNSYIGLYKLPEEVSGDAVVSGFYLKKALMPENGGSDERRLSLKNGITGSAVPAGEYELHYIVDGRYVLDSLPLTVTGWDREYPPHLNEAPSSELLARGNSSGSKAVADAHIALRGTAEGYEVMVSGFVPKPLFATTQDEESRYELALYVTQEEGLTQFYQAGLSRADSLRRWDLTPGVRFEEWMTLPIQTHFLRVEKTPSDGGEEGGVGHEMSFVIGLPPHGVSLGFDTTASYLTNSRFKAPVTIREDLKGKFEVRSLSITIEERGTPGPHCYVHNDELINDGFRLDADGTAYFRTPQLPGEYVVRLYAPVPGTGYLRLIDQALIQTSLPDVHLKLVTPSEISTGEDVKVRIEKGDAAGDLDGDHFSIAFTQRGFLTKGGAKVYPQIEVRGGGPPRRGAKLEDQSGYTCGGPNGPSLVLLYYGRVLIDSLPFARINPERPGSPNLMFESLDREPTHQAPSLPRTIFDPNESNPCIGIDPLPPYVPKDLAGETKTLRLLGPGGDEGQPIERIDGTTPFRAELRFSEVPSTAPTEVTLRWSEDPAGVEVAGTGEPQVYSVLWTVPWLECELVATDDPLVFRTEWYSLGAAAPSIPTPLGSLGEYSAEHSARIASELFAGRWDVAHTGGQFAGSIGSGTIADNGERSVLSLQVGGEQRQFQSIEMLATRDATGNKHTLDLRMVDIGPAPSAPLEEVEGHPESTVFYVTGLTKTLSVMAQEEELDVPITLPAPLAPPDARFIRVQLMAREDGSRLVGAWSTESVNGALGQGGQQTWSRQTRIAGAIPLEIQRPLGNRRAPPTLLAFSDASQPTPSGLLDKADALDRTTTYPFAPGAAPQAIHHRTLFVYGTGLPQHAADALVLESSDPSIEYTLVTLPGEGQDKLLADGWDKTKPNADGSSPNAQTHSALVLKATFKEGVTPGSKAFTVNGALGLWHLDFADANAFLSFAHRWREDNEQGEARGEFQPTNTLYSSDTAYIVLNEGAAIPHSGVALTLLLNDKPVASLWAARQGGHNGADYRTPPIRLIHRGERFREPPGAEGALDLEVVPGDKLSVELYDRTLLNAHPAQPQAKIVGKPSDLGDTWKDALVRTAACYGESALDFDAMTSEKADEYSRFILTENIPELFTPAMWSLLKKRRIEISKGDHAAAILIRDEFVRMMRIEIPRMRAEMLDDEQAWEFFLSARTSKKPFWELTRVAGPQDKIWTLQEVLLTVNHNLASVAHLAGIGEFQVYDPNEENVRDLVLRLVDYPEQWGMTPREAHLTAFAAMRKAYLGMLDLAEAALARAVDAGDDDCSELMLIAGQNADVIVGTLLPRLVRLPRGGTRLHFEPDFTAQGFVRSLKVKGAALRALKEYGQIDDTYKALAVAAVTAGGGFVLSAAGAVSSGAGVVLAGDIIDMVAFGGTDALRALESDELLSYAQGAALTMGTAFHEEALAQRTEWWQAAVGIILPGLGATSNLSSLHSLHRAERGARVLGKLDRLDQTTLAMRGEEELIDLGAYFTELDKRRPTSFWGNLGRTANNLSSQELIDLARFDQFFAKSDLAPVPLNAPVGHLLADAEAPTVRLDTAEYIPAPRVDSPTRLDAPSTLIDPPIKSKRSASGVFDKTPSFKNSEELAKEQRAIKASIRTLPSGSFSINGGTAQINIGEFLGEGRTATAFRDGANRERVYRIMRPGYSPMDFQIDEFGDKRLRFHEAGSDGLYRVPERYGVWHVENVSDPRFKHLEGAFITLVDRASGTAAERIAKQPNGITRGQMHALDQTTRYLNRRGLAWTDNHFGNFDVEPIDEAKDLWRVVIFDTGGFFPAMGRSALDRHTNARSVQEAFNLPGGQWMSQWRKAAVLPEGEARTKEITRLRTQRGAHAFAGVAIRINFKKMFGDGESGMIGSPMGMVFRPGYRKLAAQPPALADELSWRYLGTKSPVGAPADPTKPVRTYTPDQLDDLERILLGG